MKACCRCGRVQPLDAFHLRAREADGHNSMCKSCIRKYKRAWRRNNIEKAAATERKWNAIRRERKTKWKAANPEKIHAHSAVDTAVRAGTLVKPDTCSDCGATGRIHGHHADYSRPLDVEWLCTDCHFRRHSDKETA